MSVKSILLVEDQLEICNYVELALRFEGHELVVARDAADVARAMRNLDGRLALVLVDLAVPGQDGLDVIREIRKNNAAVPIVAFAAGESRVLTLEAARQGATAFLPKPFTHEQLLSAIRTAMLGRRPVNDQAMEDTESPSGMFCLNERMRKIRDALRQIALSDVPVVLRGESGVGKEVVAREIHALSARRDKPFVKINCVALPSELLESELFGYERGAFTGALKNTPGKFEAADGGVILLDEIGDMDIKLQAKLLHVLQDSEFQRLGSRETVKVNVRVLAATHCNLEQAIAEKRFREDLYYRLNVITIRIPPLRERQDEIVPLAAYFLRRHAAPGAPLPSLTPALERALLAHPWPGNIRELENVMRRYLVFPDPKLIISELEQQAEMVAVEAERPAREPLYMPRPVPADIGRGPGLDEFRNEQRRQEKQAIIDALNEAQWNRVRAAALLQIDYRKLLYKIRRHGIAPTRATPQPREHTKTAAAS
ncbi:MAG: sigma-54-dependent transcriptional regulator [bacterium]|jgi:DNA-binding NtrC family response regulator